MRGPFSMLVVMCLVLVGCSSDPTTSDEFHELEQQLATVEEQVAEVIAERDALAAAGEATTERYEKAALIHEEIIAILDNPEGYGSEEEIADLLATHATSDALMDDAVFGPVMYRAGFYNTLFSGFVDAEIDVYHDWLTEDGSSGGFLWMWHGTNAAGNPFELAGISLVTHDDDGLISYELVTYPYPDDYVDNAVFGSGN